MPTRKIIKYPGPLLKKKSKAVKRVDDKVLKLLRDMADTMYEAPGVGLAAPQVGELLRVIIVDIGEGLISVINPKVIRKSGEQTFVEGCLSVPNLEAPVKRASKIIVKGLDRHGKPMKLEAEGFLATALQHEIDHLDGKLFIDRVSDPSQIKTVTPAEARDRDWSCRQGEGGECMI